MTIRTYSSPEAFKQALEQRLRMSAKTGAEFARKRQILVLGQLIFLPSRDGSIPFYETEL